MVKAPADHARHRGNRATPKAIRPRIGSCGNRCQSSAFFAEIPRFFGIRTCRVRGGAWTYTIYHVRPHSLCAMTCKSSWVRMDTTYGYADYNGPANLRRRHKPALTPRRHNRQRASVVARPAVLYCLRWYVCVLAPPLSSQRPSSLLLYHGCVCAWCEWCVCGCGPLSPSTPCTRRHHHLSTKWAH